MPAESGAASKGRKYLVGYVGVMGKQEGIDLLLQAVQLIVHHLKRTELNGLQQQVDAFLLART